MKYLPAILLFVLGLSLSIEAQQQQQQSPPRTTSAAGGRTVTELLAAGSASVVKGAPFSAEAVSESVQTLADGNRITRSYATRMFRDSEGRFRREGSAAGGGFNVVGGETSVSSHFAFISGSLQDTISIFDPVANVRYFLNTESKTARRVNVPNASSESAVIVNGAGATQAYKVQIEKNAALRTQIVTVPSMAITANGGAVSISGGHSANSRTDSLGARDFEGVAAEGTRTVTTIPAGSIGNERPIEIVYERWYSKELQMIVYSRHADPRFGEQVYRLTNISRSEPDRSLFTVPPDYKIVSESSFNVVTRARQQ